MRRSVAFSVDASLLRKGDPLTLTHSNESALEFSLGSHDGQHESRHWSVPAREYQVLYEKIDSDSSGCQRPHEVRQFAEIACEPIYAVHDDCVVGLNNLEQLVECRSDHNAKFQDQDRD